MTKAPVPAIWYFDIVSPFAALALARLDAIGARRPVVLRPVVFGALLKHWGQLGPAEIGPKRLHTYRMATHQAETMGVPFAFPAAHPFNPLAMLRLLTALGSTRASVGHAFSLVWGEGRDANAAETLAAVANEAGDPGALERASSAGTKEALRLATEEAVKAGIFGVPSLLIDGEVFWGVDAMELARIFLDAPQHFESPAYARLRDLPVGITRTRA